MTKRVICLFALSLSLSAWCVSPRRSADDRKWYEDGVTGLAYWYDNVTGEAEVADWYSEEDEVYEYYEQSELTVPQNFIFDYGSMHMDAPGGLSGKTYKVTALGEYAFRKAAASKLSFEEPSNVKTIKAFALYMMANLGGTLVLPEGLEKIEHDAIGGAGMPTKKLVLPSTLTELGLSAVVLTEADSLEFLGDEPPFCVTAESNDAYNPWTSAGGKTGRDIVVVVPQGRRAAYVARAGIGDYFTKIVEKGGNTTGMGQTVSMSRDAARPGVWSLRGEYLGASNVLNILPAGVYVVDGSKVAK